MKKTWQKPTVNHLPYHEFMAFYADIFEREHGVAINYKDTESIMRTMISYAIDCAYKEGVTEAQLCATMKIPPYMLEAYRTGIDKEIMSLAEFITLCDIARVNITLRGGLFDLSIDPIHIERRPDDPINIDSLDQKRIRSAINSVGDTITGIEALEIISSIIFK